MQLDPLTRPVEISPKPTGKKVELERSLQDVRNERDYLINQVQVLSQTISNQPALQAQHKQLTSMAASMANQGERNTMLESGKNFSQTLSVVKNCMEAHLRANAEVGTNKKLAKLFSPEKISKTIGKLMETGDISEANAEKLVSALYQKKLQKELKKYGIDLVQRQIIEKDTDAMKNDDKQMIKELKKELGETKYNELVKILKKDIKNRIKHIGIQESVNSENNEIMQGKIAIQQEMSATLNKVYGTPTPRIWPGLPIELPAVSNETTLQKDKTTKQLCELFGDVLRLGKLQDKESALTSSLNAESENQKKQYGDLSEYIGNAKTNNALAQYFRDPDTKKPPSMDAMMADMNHRIDNLLQKYFSEIDKTVIGDKYKVEMKKHVTNLIVNYMANNLCNDIIDNSKDKKINNALISSVIPKIETSLLDAAKQYEQATSQRSPLNICDKIIFQLFVEKMNIELLGDKSLLTEDIVRDYRKNQITGIDNLIAFFQSYRTRLESSPSKENISDILLLLSQSPEQKNNYTFLQSMLGNPDHASLKNLIQSLKGLSPDQNITAAKQLHEAKTTMPQSSTLLTARVMSGSNHQDASHTKSILTIPAEVVIKDSKREVEPVKSKPEVAPVYNSKITTNEMPLTINDSPKENKVRIIDKSQPMEQPQQQQQPQRKPTKI